jgi:hypothetical protein
LGRTQHTEKDLPTNSLFKMKKNLTLISNGLDWCNHVYNSSSTQNLTLKTLNVAMVLGWFFVCWRLHFAMAMMFVKLSCNYVGECMQIWQDSNSTILFSWIVTIETKSLEILEACNSNVRGIEQWMLMWSYSWQNC